MLAVAEHAVPGLSAMAIDEACTWSRRRTHGSALVASRGASTRRRFSVRAESPLPLVRVRQWRKLARRGLRFLNSPGFPAEALCLGG